MSVLLICDLDLCSSMLVKDLRDICHNQNQKLFAQRTTHLAEKVCILGYMLTKKQVGHQEKYLAGVDKFIELGRNYKVEMEEVSFPCLVPYCNDHSKLTKFYDPESDKSCMAVLCPKHYEDLKINVEKGLQCKGKRKFIEPHYPDVD